MPLDCCTKVWYISVKFQIMARNTSITLGNHFEEIIQKSINSGRYASASEVVRAGLRLVEKEESKVVALREAIEAGENSGYIKDFERGNHLAEIKRKHIK